MSQSRYWALAARIIANVGAILLFLYCGGASALDRATTRLSRHRWLQDFLYALALLLFVFVVTLPAPATFVIALSAFPSSHLQDGCRTTGSAGPAPRFSTPSASPS